MKKLALGIITAFAIIAGSSAQAQIIASDVAANYSNGWTDVSNEGTGFQPWIIAVDSGSGFAGVFTGDPGVAQIAGLTNVAFGMYANPQNSGAFATADRNFSMPLAVGHTFRFKWGVNWDSAGSGNKGFNLYAGGAGSTQQLVNVNMGGSEAITVNGVNTGFGYGTNAMTWEFTLLNANTLRVFANARDGSAATFTTNITVSGSPDGFRWYVSGLESGDLRQPYYDNLEIEAGEPPALQFVAGVSTPGALGEIEFTLLRTVGAVGDQITLSSSNPGSVTVPTGVTFAALATNVSFDATVVSLTNGAAVIIASNVSSGAWAEYTVTPIEPVLTLTGPANITAGGIATYTLTRSASVADLVNLEIGFDMFATVPATVSFPPNVNLVTFKVTATATTGTTFIAATNNTATATPLPFTVINAPAGIYDDASLYFNSWFNGDNSGSGFTPWELTANGGGNFIGAGAFGDRTNLAALDSAGVSFGLWANNNSEAKRGLQSPLNLGDKLTFSFGFQYDDGNRGFDLLASGDSTVFNMNISPAGYVWTGGSSSQTVWEAGRSNGVVVDVEVIATSAGFKYNITSLQDTNLVATGSVASAAISGFKFYVNSTPGGSGNDFFFNKPQVVSTPTLAVSGPDFIMQNGIATFTVTRSAGVSNTVNLVSSTPSVVGVPATVTFSGSDTITRFQVPAGALGGTTFTASNDDATSDAFPVSVIAAPSGVSDVAANYDGSWFSGDKSGNGFSAWTFNHTQGSGFAGVFIGNPANAGISGMNAASFGFYANPQGSGANAEVSRSFDNALAVGEVFSFVWGLNFDSGDENSNRGFNLKAGGTQLLNINMGNNATITIDGSPMFTNYGAQAISLNFEHVTAGNLRVYGTGRDGVETFDQTFAVAAAPDNFAFYFNATSGEAERQMYVNNFAINLAEVEIPAIPNFAVSSALGARVAVSNSLVGTSYLLEATTNLVANPVIWTPVDADVGTGGTIILSDDPLSAAPLRIYRMAIGNP